MSGQHLSRQKLSDNDQTILRACRALMSDTHFESKGEYSGYTNGNLNQLLKKLEGLNIVKVRRWKVGMNTS